MTSSSRNFEEDNIVARASALTCAANSTYQGYIPVPLPGVIIFVHGVNSEGEWFDQTEQGLCAGLNERMRLKDHHIAVPPGDLLVPATYQSELTPMGFISPKLGSDTFISAGADSPIIRFRWGYRAEDATVAAVGGNIWLNELDAWGGGPFANGCSALPDMWNDGVDDRLFLWLTANDLNTVPGRDVYACPHRAYYAHAAWRLARLVALIREKHRTTNHGECPVTLICHSQGNMIGLASAFIGDKKYGGDGVADTYILANPPYSLLPDNLTENWAQRHLQGRQNGEARLHTLKAFLDLVRKRQGMEQADWAIDKRCANNTPKDGSTPWNIAEDKKDNRFNQGRVFLYCNPYDQVISSRTIQGIGWLGMSQDEINNVGGNGVLYQRVWGIWKDGTKIGKDQDKDYDYWANRWHAKEGEKGYWYPPAPVAKFHLKRVVNDQNRNPFEKLGVILVGLTIDGISKIYPLAINADPLEHWKIPVTAPKLPEDIEGIEAKARRMIGGEMVDGNFDEGKELEEWQLAQNPEVTDDHDVYRKAQREESLAAQGDANSEAQLRYEHHARIRMEARRQGGELAENAKHLKQDELDKLPTQFREWSDSERIRFIRESRDGNATDHSTILTNATHAEKVIAYDLPIGYCRFGTKSWMELRQLADWRWMSRRKEDVAKYGLDYGEYFKEGTIDKKPLQLHPYYQSSVPKLLGMTDDRTHPEPKDDEGHGR